MTQQSSGQSPINGEHAHHMCLLGERESALEVALHELLERAYEEVKRKEHVGGSSASLDQTEDVFNADLS